MQSGLNLSTAHRQFLLSPILFECLYLCALNRYVCRLLLVAVLCYVKIVVGYYTFEIRLPDLLTGRQAGKVRRGFASE